LKRKPFCGVSDSASSLREYSRRNTMNYWLSRDGKKQGPYSLPDLQSMLAGRVAAATDLVWADGMPAWTPLSHILGPAPAMASGGAAFEPQYVSPPASAVAAKPPSLHWAVVLALAFVTFGIFPLIWLFVQARFAKKLDPKSKSGLLLLASLVAVMAEFLFAAVNEITIRRGGQATDISTADSVLYMFATIFAISAIFQMRQTFQTNYNLRLNPVLTFFFNVYYFQYHLRRIAR
jgi:hypothetical protein